VTTHFELPYGKGKVSIDLPMGWNPDLFRPKPIPSAKNPLHEIIGSLEHPLGKRRLEDYRGIKSVAIAISDETRFIPYHLILPPLLERLGRMGIGPSAIHFLIASGLHPPMLASRFPNLLPHEILRKYAVTVHDAWQKDLKFLGNTSRRTPVYLNPIYYDADLRLVIGLIDPHQFVGYTGGVKGAAIGLAGAQTIEANHWMLFHPKAVIGEIQENPVRQDIEEIGKLIGIHFVMDVVQNETNEIVKVISGDPFEVEQVGSEFCRSIYETIVTKEYDLVIASPGGYPKDLNVYQAQKALAHVTPLVRQDGDILFFAECPDGPGDDLFYQKMIQHRVPEEVVEIFRKEEFKMGMHKAFLWCRSLTKAQVHLYSALEEKLAIDLMTLPVKNPQEVFEKFKVKYINPPQVAIVPKAASTYVRFQKNN
jgi:nickel-dependent lactate racemase